MKNLQLIRRFSFASLAISFVCCSSICNAQTINWFPDPGAAAQVAVAENKTILLHFGADSCRDCDQLDTFVYTDPTVQRAFDQSLIAVKVNADTQKDLVEEFGVTSLPMDIAVSPAGEILSKRKSPTVAASYLKMISDFETTRTKLEDPNSQIENAAYQIKQMANESSGIKAQTASFTPSFPYQSPHQPAASSTALKKQGQIVKNPFVQGGPQGGTRLANQPTGAIPMAPGQVLPQAAALAAPMTMPKPVQMPGQLTLPPEMKLAEPLTPPRTVANQFSVTENHSNDFMPKSGNAVEGELTVNNQFGSAKPVAPRNTALQRLEQSDIAARLVREQAQQKRENFKADPKVVMDDRLTVMNRGVDPPGTKASLASSSKSILKTGSPVERGLDQAASTPAKPTYALHGKCPVALLTKSKWIDGEDKIGCVHRNRVYIFASQENLQLFQTDPDAYSPILAGYDPVIFEETGRLVDGMEEYGVFMGKTPKQRIVLFASPETRARFQLEPRRYLQTVRQAMDKSSSSSTMR